MGLAALALAVGGPEYAATIAAALAKAEPRGTSDAAAILDAAARDAGIGGRFVVVDLPPGSGKSHHARGLLPRGVVRYQGGVLLTPTVALAQQHHERTGAELRAGPLHPIRGRGECKQPDEVKFAYSLGLSAAPVCMACPHRQDCTARDAMGDADKGIITTHERAGEFAGERPVWVDEWPNTSLRTWTLPKSGLVEAIERVVPERHRDGSPIEGREELLAWARDIEAGRFDTTARWLAALSTTPPPVFMRNSRTVEAAERGQSTIFDFKKHRTYRKDVQVAIGVWRAARADARFTDAGEEWALTGLVDVLWMLRKWGGLLLASGAPAASLKALRPDVELRRVERIADGRPIRRVMVQMADMATRKLKSEPGRARLQRVVRDVEHRAREFGARPDEVAVFVAKDLAGVVASALPAAKVGTFGGLRGKDAWIGCRVFAVIGDHFENQESNEREAEYFDVDAKDLWTEKVACEKEQAFGRAREPQTGAPALMLCYGRVVPNRWAGRIDEVEQWGRVDVARIQALKAQGMTQAAVAKEMGIGERSVRTYWYAQIDVASGEGK